jgi:uncharacterized membrane protein
MTGSNMMDYDHMIMAIIWLLVIGLGILLLATLFPKSTSETTGSPKEPGDDRRRSATQILKRRYARGEISQELYERMRHEVEQSINHTKRIEQ